MSEIRDVPVVMRALSNLPGAKPDHRYIGESLQRLKQAEQIHLVRGKWKTTSPTA
jgi:hypothetical protein